MKDNQDSDKDLGPTAINRSLGPPDLSFGLGSHLGGPRLGTHPSLPGNFTLPPHLHQQLQFAGLAAHPPGLVYPSLLPNNISQAAFMASLSNRHEHMMRGCPPLAPLIPTSGAAAPTLANFHATLSAADMSRHHDLFAYLKDNVRKRDELFSVLSKFTTTSVISSTSSSLSLSSLSSSSSPSSSSSFHMQHQDSPAKSDVSPIDKRSPRPSSISPSSYMTPRSMNGSPSIGTPSLASHLMSPNNMHAHTFGGEAMSPPSVGSSSPLAMNNRIDSTSQTPTRKASTPKNEKVFPCKICTRSFGYKHVLQNHERTHTGEKPFECKECHKRFTRDHHLKTHMRLHTGEKPYHCTQCDRQFVQVANLRRHLRVHTGEKPYACENCPSKFSDSNQLKAHLLIHKGEKPFTCNKCSKIFRRRHHLIHHKCLRDPDDEDKLLGPLSYSKDLTSYSDSETIPYRDIIYHDELNETTDDSMPASTVLEDEPQMERRRGRKSKEPRRIVHHGEEGGPTSINITPPLVDRLNSMIAHHQLPPTPLPEQTEPEDLSLNGPRSIYRANIALATSGYAKNPLRYPKEEFMSDEDGTVSCS